MEEAMKKITHYIEQLNQAEKKISDKSDKIRELENKNENLLSDKSNLLDAIRTLNERNNSLVERNKQLDNENTKLIFLANDLENTIENLKAVIEAFGNQIKKSFNANQKDGAKADRFAHIKPSLNAWTV